MNAIVKAAKTDKALKVLGHVYDGMPITAACEEVGLSRSAFYYICNNNPEELMSYQEILTETTNMQIAIILAKRHKVLEKLIEDASSDRTKPKEWLAIYEALEEALPELMDGVMRSLYVKHDNKALLTGPVTRLIEQRNPGED